MRINIDYDIWENFFADVHETFEVAEQNQSFTVFTTETNSAIKYAFEGRNIAGDILVAKIAEHITVSKWHLRLGEELHIHRAGRKEEQGLLFNFVKSKNIQFDVANDENRFERKYNFKSEDINGWTVVSPDLDVDASFPKDSTLDMINIRLEKAWLLSQMDSEKNIWLMDAEASNMEKSGQMNAAISHNFDDLMLCPTDKDTFLLQFQASLYQLIVNVNDVMNGYANNPPYGINYNDLVDIGQTERIIMNCLTSSLPSMKTLAQESNMSVTKFMRIFKKVYQSTPYEYYQKQRMNYAKKLIAENKASVTEAGRIVGYKSLSHFSVAFKKEFGRLPSEL